MVRTLEDRVERLEAIVRKTPGWAQYRYIEWQKDRAAQLRLQGMSGRQAKDKAWHEAQHIDFTKENV